jgi:protease-4
MMSARILAILLFCASFALADSTTTPSTQPATQQARNFPTPMELLARMKQMKADADQATKVAYFDLSKPIVERPADFSLFGDNSGSTLRSLMDRMNQARQDKTIRAVLITLSQPAFNLAQAQEIRDSLIELRRAGKKTFVYADTYDTTGYTVASGATNIVMLGGGEIMMPGIGMEAMFAKGLLDKLGVHADYVQIGEFKGADEQFTRTAPSEEMRGEMNKLIDALYAQIIDGISLNRNLTGDQVKQLIDDAMMNGPVALDRGLVDHLTDIDGVRNLIAEELGEDEVVLVHDYGQPEQEEIDLSSPFALFSMMSRKQEVSDKPAVALIYVDGVIVDGEGGASLLGDSAVGSDDLREALRIAGRDERVEAIVLRIDSPGGSAVASEAVWQAARRVAADKPIIVSVGSMAASGGYYIASAGETIFADPSAIVGSIGVVGGKFVMKDLFDKVGLTTESFNRGRNADLFSSNQPFTDRQRRMIVTWMKQTYDQFTNRILTTRKDKIADIDKVARGRIFLANQAKELGLIDEIGGLRDALAFAADKADLDEGEYDVRVLPEPKSLAELFFGGEVASPIRPQVHLPQDSLMNLLPTAQRQMLSRQIQILQLFQLKPVVLVSPYMLNLN